VGVCKRCDSKGVGSKLGCREGKERINAEFAESTEGTERRCCELQIGG
jgi:hypothetical protein